MDLNEYVFLLLFKIFFLKMYHTCTAMVEVSQFKVKKKNVKIVF